VTAAPPLASLLLPRTDGGVLAQLITVIVATVVVATLVRRERSLVILTIGVGTVTLGLMGLRTLH